MYIHKRRDGIDADEVLRAIAELYEVRIDGSISDAYLVSPPTTRRGQREMSDRHQRISHDRAWEQRLVRSGYRQVGSSRSWTHYRASPWTR